MCLVISLDQKVTSLEYLSYRIYLNHSKVLSNLYGRAFVLDCFRSFTSSHWMAGFPFLILLILFTSNPGSMSLARCSQPQTLSVPGSWDSLAKWATVEGQHYPEGKATVLLNYSQPQPWLTLIGSWPQQNFTKTTRNEQMHCKPRDEYISWSSENQGGMWCQPPQMDSVCINRPKVGSITRGRPQDKGASSGTSEVYCENNEKTGCLSFFIFK